VYTQLITRFLLVTLLLLAAPFSVGGERVIAHEAVTGAVGALAEAGQFDTRIDVDEPLGPSQETSAAAEPQVTETDAQECALPMDGVWSADRTISAAVDSAQRSVPSPALAGLDRPPRGR
jgi:hypothetical protein